VELDEVLRRRRMVRSFRTEPVPRSVLEGVLGAAFRAPAAGNSDALDVVVLTGDETARYWSVTFADPARRAAFRWQGLLAAPALAVVVTSPAAYPDRYAEPDKAATGLGAGEAAWAVPFWWVDAGMAVENVLLAAVAAGLGACFFGLFGHERAVLEALGVPADRRGVGTIALGWPAPDEPGRSARRQRAGTLNWTEWSRNLDADIVRSHGQADPGRQLPGT
jgi:nitroreductase